MLQAYLETYDPPIPVLDVMLSYPDEEQWQGPFVAIVDSGADFTIIPYKTYAESPCAGCRTDYCPWTNKPAQGLTGRLA